MKDELAWLIIGIMLIGLGAWIYIPTGDIGGLIIGMCGAGTFGCTLKAIEHKQKEEQDGNS